MTAVSPVIAVARLQLTLLSHKRVILALVSIWVLRALLLVQVGGSLILPAGMQLLLPTLLVTDLLVVAMTCGLIADDAAHGTFPFLLANGVGRRAFLAGKLLAVVGVAVTFATLAHVVTVILPSAPAIPVAEAATRIVLASTLSLVRVLVIAAATAWLAVVLTNRYVAAMAALFYVYGLAWMLHRAAAPGDPGVWLAESLLPWRDTLDRAVETLFSGRVNPVLVATSLLQPILYAIVFAVLAAWSLERRDLARAE